MSVVSGRVMPDLRRRWRPVWYPSMLAAVWVMSIATITAVSPYAALRSVLFALVLVLGITAVLTRLLRDRDRAGVFAVAILIALLSGHFPDGLVAPVGIAAIVLLEWRLAIQGGSRFPWPAVTRVGNLAAAVAALALTITALQNGVAESAIRDIWNHGPAAAVRNATASSSATGRPDIWVVLLDGRARSDKLLELYARDDEPFIQAMASRGFETSRDSRSNYLQTQLSLASMLNLSHLDAFPELASLPNHDPHHVVRVRSLINDNPAFDALRDGGYEVISVSSGWEVVTMREADRFIDTGQLNEFELRLAEISAAEGIVTGVAPTFFDDQQRSRIREGFQSARDIAAEPREQARFVFVHIPAPHAPLLIDREGRALDGPGLGQFYGEQPEVDRLGRQGFIDRYAGLVAYLDHEVLATVDSIVANSAVPPVIVVLSDHGSGLGWHLGDPRDSDLDDRTANFFSYLAPGHQGLFPDDTTLVTTMPRLLNTYLGTSFIEPPDDLYAWKGTSSFDLVPIRTVDGS